MIYYSEDYPEEYIIIADDESTISFASVPTAADIVWVELETKPLRLSQFSWNATSRILTLGYPAVSPSDPRYVQTFAGQLVKIIYKLIRVK